MQVNDGLRVKIRNKKYCNMERSWGSSGWRIEWLKKRNKSVWMLTASEGTGTDRMGEEGRPYYTGPGRPCILVFILKSDYAEDCRS